MKLIRNQFLETKKIDHVSSCSILVIVIGDHFKNALSSLKEQIYTNMRVVCINEFIHHVNLSGEVNVSHFCNDDIAKRIADVVGEATEDYVYLMYGNDSLFPQSLLEYARYLEKSDCDVLYADECSGDIRKDLIYDYEIKPDFEPIAASQSLYSGRAVIFKKKALYEVIGKASSKELDTLLRELFLLCVENNAQVGKIPLVLLLKGNSFRDAEGERELLPLIQKNIEKHTKWYGRLSKSSGYNQFAFEMLDDLSECSVDFLVIEENQERTRQLISQIEISYSNNRILVGVPTKDMEGFSDWCKDRGFSNVVIVPCEENYVSTLRKMCGNAASDVQILLNDRVQWLNRMNVERLVGTFCKPEVKVACPQIATEGEDPRLIYAGGEMNSLALTSNYLKGRMQNVIWGYDPAWTNHQVTNLTFYCMAVRKEVWNQVFPMHSSITEAYQFAQELSFACKKNSIVCEYSAQSAFWVTEELGDMYSIVDDHVRIEDNLDKTRCAGNYWHWLSEYSDIIEENARKMQYAQRSYYRYLQESFRVYGLEHVKQNGNKRVLVVSHELSLTGAPLVLVQAVKVLKKMDYDVLVVSPVDGPLRETYLDSHVPVIIEPQLLTDFEYIKIAYDFDFVIACTVCLWQLIDVLGQTDIPVLWWVHDSRMGYVNWLRYVLPETIGDNIHLYCGGDYAQKVILDYRPRYTSKILLYGLEDFSDKIGITHKRADWNIPEGKIAFANIAQIISRKGQDVLVAAIEKMPKDLLEQSVFIFVGGVVDRKIYNRIMDLQEHYPDSIRYIKQINHEELKEFYREIDCVICSSTDDPLPAFVAEALMMSRVVICSKNTAFNGLIEDKKNGYLFDSGNVDMLYDCICDVLKNKDELSNIEQNARKLYEQTFTREIFEKNIREVVCNELL